MKKFKSKRWKKPFAKSVHIEGDSLIAVFSAKDLGIPNGHLYHPECLSLSPKAQPKILSDYEFARSICISNPGYVEAGRDIKPLDRTDKSIDCIFDRESLVTALGGPLYGEHAPGHRPTKLGEIKQVFIRRRPARSLRLIIQSTEEQLTAQAVEKHHTQNKTLNSVVPVVRRPAHLKRKFTESHDDRTKSHYGE